MNKIRYLLIGDGTSPHLLKWTTELVKYYDVFLLSSRGIHEGIEKLLPADHLFPLDLSLKTEGGNLSLIFQVRKVFTIIRKINPSVVNAHYITSHGLLAAIVRQLPTMKFFLVQSAWGTDILVTPFTSAIYRLSTSYSLNRAQLITSDSEFMTGVIRNLSRTPVMTFPFGLDRLPEFDPDRKQTGLFFSNRIHSENYNIDEVLRFFSRIAKEDEKARLEVANDGDLHESLVELSRELKIADRVNFRGFMTVSEQSELFEKAEYFISIPTSDSTSVSLLEAMAYGCIPVLSDIPANREWVEHGKGGIFYTAQLNNSDLSAFRLRKDSAIELNRKLILEKAIFPDSIKRYSQSISQHIKEF
jgi:L-malate glycosyltransferase